MKASYVSRRLYRGVRPESYSELKLRVPGVSIIVDLQSGIANFFKESLYETQTPRSQSVRRDSHHFSPFKRPSPERLVEIATDIQEYINAGETVFVHCAEGVDRTGLVIAVHRVLYQGWAPEDALKELYYMGHHRYRYFWWVKSFWEALDIFGYEYK